MLRQLAIVGAKALPQSLKNSIHRNRALSNLSRRFFGALTAGEPIVITSGPMRGLRLAHSEHLSHAHISGTYELATQVALDWLTQPGFVTYDLGASIGYLSILMARKAKKVFAFEPAPHAARELQRNAAENGFGNIEVVGSPVSDGFRTVRFNLTDVAYGSSINDGVEDRWPTIELTTTTLNAFARQTAYPDLIKIDVEGEEGRVLREANELLARHPRLLVEVHSRELAVECADILTSYGYRLLRLDRSPFTVPNAVIPGEAHIVALHHLDTLSS